MKQLSKTTILLIALSVVLAALGALGGAVARVATDASFYVDDSRLAVARYLGREIGEDGLTQLDETAVTKYIGITREEQTVFASEIARQMRQPDATFGLDLLQSHEQQHMRDVRDLVLLADKVAQMGTLVAAILVLAAAWTGAGLARRKRAGLFGALCGVGALALIVGGFALAMSTAGFERLFYGMHELLFTNRYWLLNPTTDILIRMMPQPLFEFALVKVLADAGVRFVIVLAILAALYGIVGGMIRRNVTERERA